MTLKKTAVHEMHERHEKQQWVAFIQRLTHQIKFHGKKVLWFCSCFFVYFVDDTEVFGMAQLGIIELKGAL